MRGMMKPPPLLCGWGLGNKKAPKKGRKGIAILERKVGSIQTEGQVGNHEVEVRGLYGEPSGRHSHEKMSGQQVIIVYDFAFLRKINDITCAFKLAQCHVRSSPDVSSVSSSISCVVQAPSRSRSNGIS